MNYISANRCQLSQWLTGSTTDEELQRKLNSLPAPECEKTGYCKVR